MCMSPKTNSRITVEPTKDCCKKEQDVAGEGGHVEVGQHFSGTSVLVLAPADKHNTVQCKSRNEVKKQAWTIGGSRPPKTPKAL